MSASPLDLVARLTAAVATAHTLAEVFDATLEGPRCAFNMERASILVFDPDGVVPFKAWCDRPDWYPATKEGHTRWSIGQPAPEPVLVPDVPREPTLTA